MLTYQGGARLSARAHGELPGRSVADRVAPAFAVGFGLYAVREARRVLAETEPEDARSTYLTLEDQRTNLPRPGYVAALAEALERFVAAPWPCATCGGRGMEDGADWSQDCPECAGFGVVGLGAPEPGAGAGL